MNYLYRSLFCFLASLLLLCFNVVKKRYSQFSKRSQRWADWWECAWLSQAMAAQCCFLLFTVCLAIRRKRVWYPLGYKKIKLEKLDQINLHELVGDCTVRFWTSRLFDKSTSWIQQRPASKAALIIPVPLKTFEIAAVVCPTFWAIQQGW